MEGDLLDAVEASVETGMNRVMSGVFQDQEAGVCCSGERQDKDKEVEYQRLVKEDGERWAGKGLGLLEDGSVPKMDRKGLEHVLKEFARGAIRGGGMGAALKGSLSLLFALIGGKGNIGKAVKAALESDTFRFGAFLGGFTGLFRGLNALFTILAGKDQSQNAMLAGGIAGVAVLLDEVKRRQMIALYLFSRSLDVLTKQLVREGVIPYWKHFEALMFGVANMPIMYGFLFMPEILQPSYYKWILRMGDVTDIGLKGTLRERRAAVHAGGTMPFRGCAYGYHEGPCTPYCAKDWFLGLGRAGKIYLPVHLAPLLLFRFSALAKDPTTQLLRTGKGFISSCIFLTTYQFTVKYTQCLLRNYRQTDDGWHALLAGLLTGVSTVFEQPSRVSELMLYCLPRGMEAAWIYLEKQGVVKSIPKFEAVFMAVAMAVLVGSRKTDNKHTYYNTLCFLLGSKSAADDMPAKRKQSKHQTEQHDAKSKSE